MGVRLDTRIAVSTCTCISKYDLYVGVCTQLFYVIIPALFCCSAIPTPYCIFWWWAFLTAVPYVWAEVCNLSADLPCPCMHKNWIRYYTCSSGWRILTHLQVSVQSQTVMLFLWTVKPHNAQKLVYKFLIIQNLMYWHITACNVILGKRPTSLIKGGHNLSIIVSKQGATTLKMSCAVVAGMQVSQILYREWEC